MASSSNNQSENSTIPSTVYKLLQEDMERVEKLNLLVQNFHQADKKKSQIIHTLQEKPNLSKIEEDYLSLLRSHCVQDWQSFSACTELSTLVRQQIAEKDEFLRNARVLNEDSNIPSNFFAESVEDFFFNGDKGKTSEEQFCIIGFYDQMIKCSRKFWGVLLGYTENNVLWVKHVDAWIMRSLVLHRQSIEGETVRTMTRYAVMPTSFHDDFLDYMKWHRRSDVALGVPKPYIAWRDVDVLLIPACSEDGCWYLIQFNIRKNELTIYNRDKLAIPRPYLKKVMSCYQEELLSRFQMVTSNPTSRVQPSYHATPPPSYKTLTQYSGSKATSAVYMCMFIHNLLMGETSNVVTADVSDEEEMAFRFMMASELYSTRIA